MTDRLLTPRVEAFVGMEARARTFPVIEIFGPTVQGEGPEAGVACSFVRFGGCDYRCSWCDSMYAVEPALVRKAPRMSAEQIADEIPDGPKWVIFSGGNPALLELGSLVSMLRNRGRKVAVETQGSVWRPWLGWVDRLVISPKPPSSDMATEAHRKQTKRFMDEARKHAPHRAATKIVVFNGTDYEWAVDWLREYGYGMPAYLSAGTPQLTGPRIEDRTLEAILERFRWLCETVCEDDRLPPETKVLPQLHVLAWGTKRGV